MWFDDCGMILIARRAVGERWLCRGRVTPSISSSWKGKQGRVCNTGVEYGRCELIVRSHI